ncbi:DUF4383 domain-containing protein [Candidatus Woesearchaeota archaeon]|nr:DUF4383 domain-containing protein [Candidatus Woesearchaeota archaeon]
MGAILLVVGLLGFVTGDMVLWFSVNGTHTWIHLLSGIIGLFAGLSAKGAYAGTYNKTFGVIYLVIAVLGFLSIGGIVDWLALNAADNWLHLVIGAVAAWVGFKA